MLRRKHQEIHVRNQIQLAKMAKKIKRFIMYVKDNF